MKKRLIGVTMVCVMAAGAIAGCSQNSVKVQIPSSTESATTTVNQVEGKTPKYVFLFIGDGMSYPQVQLTNYYLNASSNASSGNAEEKPLTSSSQLTMMNFPVVGSAQTYDSTSFAPDSASTATSIATGQKTWSGSINVSEDFSIEYETIAEKLKKQKNYKVGIVSSVNINHATPAAFYAHQASRNNYYEIGQELIESEFDYFAGGALKQPTGSDKNQKDLYELAKENGYKVVKTQEEAKKLTSKDGKVIVIEDKLADSDSLAYNIDLEKGEWALKDYVEKGIEVLDNEEGFFMMVEGGKIDWACHANDAGSAIFDTVALDQAVRKAVEFYNKHPEETLILVTGDHETGGLTIGYAGTDYDTFLNNLSNQKISYAKFDTDYVKSYKENKTEFTKVMKDIEKLFGLKAPTANGTTVEIQKDSADSHPESKQDGTLLLTDYEYGKLQEAYKTTLARTGEESTFSQEEYVEYGSYEPLTVTITHILNNKSGINFASYSHTGLPVGVFAKGEVASQFEGYYDNTDIFKQLAKVTGVK
ncbi:MAG: alkaline phosphatase [bacterium]|nr:alkaline phosphatase [bacterium]